MVYFKMQRNLQALGICVFRMISVPNPHPDFIKITSLNVFWKEWLQVRRDVSELLVSLSTDKPAPLNNERSIECTAVSFCLPETHPQRETSSGRS